MANPRIVETNKKLKDSAVRIKDSAAQMERSTARVEDSADRRTELAADRTIFAAERTYSAWVRTGLVAMASGIGAKALMSDVLPEWLVITTASVLMLFSVFCFSAAVWRHLYPGPPPPSTRCCAHSSGAADFDKCVFVGRFDSGANRHLVGTDARLIPQHYLQTFCVCLAIQTMHREHGDDSKRGDDPTWGEKHNRQMICILVSTDTSRHHRRVSPASLEPFASLEAPWRCSLRQKKKRGSREQTLASLSPCDEAG
jgi:putative membrane protein